MTRAQRLMQLVADLHGLDGLRNIGSHLGVVGGYSRVGEIRAEKMREKEELRRQLGGSERREYERLYAEWSKGAAK